MKKDIFKVANKRFNSRLIVGTGKYKSMIECSKAIKLSGAAIVTVAPDPCFIIMFCDPLVAFSIIQTFETVSGPRVIVHAELNVPVYFKYKALPASADQLAIVVAWDVPLIASDP